MSVNWHEIRLTHFTQSFIDSIINKCNIDYYNYYNDVNIIELKNEN
jgi:hypothetical protein